MTTDDVRACLQSLAPTRLEVTDDSAKHAGHKHNRGGSHFSVRIESARFAGLSALARHRLVYAALGDAFKDQIHALAIEARAPGE
jgi:BolA protein